MRKPDMSSQTPRRGGKGFRRAGALVGSRVRAVAEQRGFASADVLTRWPDIAGPALAAKARPVTISHARGGMGGTLVLLCPGAVAHEVELQAELIRERVNACFGYNAVRRVRVTQTAPGGFAEAQAPFAPPEPVDTPATRRAAADLTGTVRDDTLRQALERLAVNVLSRSTPE